MRWKGQRSQITSAAMKLAASNPLILTEATECQVPAAATNVRSNGKLSDRRLTPTVGREQSLRIPA